MQFIWLEIKQEHWEDNFTLNTSHGWSQKQPYYYVEETREMTTYANWVIAVESSSNTVQATMTMNLTK